MSTRSPKQHVRFQIATQAFVDVVSSGRRADAVLASVFRDRGVRSSEDRAFIARSVYGALRWGLLVRDAVAAIRERTPLKGELIPVCSILFGAHIGGDLAESTIQTMFVTLTGLPGRVFHRLVAEVDGRRLRPAGALDARAIARTTAMPLWFVESLARERPLAEVAALCDGLNLPPPLTLRTNTYRVTRDELCQRLASAGPRVEPALHAPEALFVRGDVDVFDLDAFREGLFEVQDEGSQLISHLVDPRRSERILDACAGAGGKTLHLGALMKGRGDVIAYDPDARRLQALKKRLKRSGLQNVRIIGDPARWEGFVESGREECHAVLVDAPCSGTGTMRRNPDLKLRLSESAIGELVQKQRSILAGSARFVRPGGRLIYATCSVLEAENQAIVEYFLGRESGFELVPARVACCPDLEATPYLRLTPHEHGTDGFFAAVLVRKGGGN